MLDRERSSRLDPETDVRPVSVTPVDRVGAEAVLHQRRSVGGCPEAEIALVADGDAADQLGVFRLDVPPAIGVVEGAAPDERDVLHRIFGTEPVAVPVALPL